MNNPLDYLWYKTYKWFKCIDKGGNSATTDIGPIGAVLISNLFTIILLIFGNIPNQYVWIFIIIIPSMLSFPYLRRKKQAQVLKRYRCESEKSRITGNIIVVVYVILSIAAPFIIAKIKNGYIIQ
ncbi:MAG: hypothetical protein LBS69_06565 [Prevotellaceae bacterium]|nr:hypothetical protein [Prevotellaceae bacterium]